MSCPCDQGRYNQVSCELQVKLHVAVWQPVGLRQSHISCWALCKLLVTDRYRHSFIQPHTPDMERVQLILAAYHSSGCLIHERFVNPACISWQPTFGPTLTACLPVKPRVVLSIHPCARANAVKVIWTFGTPGMRLKCDTNAGVRF